MKPRRLGPRRWVDRGMKAASSLAVLAGLGALGWILYEVAARGVSAIQWSFLVNRTAPPGMELSGLGNAILGTFLITGLAVVLGVPAGVFAGVYLAEFGRGRRTAAAVRFVSNLLMGTPSIIVGLFAYTLVVVPMGRFSGYGGAVALAVIMLPLVARTTEDLLNLVPNTLRESALALGAPRWKATLGVVFRAARSGLLTGVLLAVARVSGETAPLLFTALNSPYWPRGLGEPTANLTVTIFNYAMSPYEDWQRMAWGGALLITAGVLFVTVVARWALKGYGRPT
jgi:phosphate transport system permease protein